MNKFLKVNIVPSRSPSFLSSQISSCPRLYSNSTCCPGLELNLSNSRDPHTKHSFSPQPDYTEYLITLNDQLKTFGQSNPLKTRLSNKKVGMNSKKDNYKGPVWLGYSSTAEPHLWFKHCFFTPPVSSGKGP